MVTLLLLLLLVGGAKLDIIHENVIFHKTNEITTTRSRWLLSFAIELEPFERFLAKVKDDVAIVVDILGVLRERYQAIGDKGALDTWNKLEIEVQYLEEVQANNQQKFQDYKLLHSRKRRAIVPAIGRILSFMFGTVSEDDLEAIRQNIINLARNQKQILHAVSQSISVLNATQLQTIENRHKLEAMIRTLNAFDHRLHNITEMLQKSITELKQFVHVYNRLNLMIGEIRDMVDQAKFYLTRLGTQVNFLSINQLSPTTIVPSDLRKLLLDLKSHLPNSLSLVNDPDTELWLFYKELMAHAVLDSDKIIVILEIPLLEVSNKFEIYQIYNLPLPVRNIRTDNDDIPDLIARYDIGSEGLLIDKDRTKFALLNSAELMTCNNPRLKFCNTRRPIFPINLSKLCVIKLFLQKHEEIRQYCQTQALLNEKLPTGIYLYNGTWAVATQKKLQFTIVCYGKGNAISTVTINPPLGLITLPMSCKASNDYLILTSFFQKESFYHAIGKQKLLTLGNISQFQILDTFRTKLQNFSKINIPKSIKHVKQIPLDHLIETLRGVSPTEVEDTSWPITIYLWIGVGLIVVTGIIALILFKKCPCIRKLCKAIQGKKAYTIGPERSVMSTPTLIADGPTLTRGDTVISAPPTQPTSEVVKNLYPSLDVGARKMDK